MLQRRSLAAVKDQFMTPNSNTAQRARNFTEGFTGHSYEDEDDR